MTEHVGLLPQRCPCGGVLPHDGTTRHGGNRCVFLVPAGRWSTDPLASLAHSAAPAPPRGLSWTALLDEINKELEEQ